MSRLILLPFRQLAKVAELAGFHIARREGSHCTFRAAGSRVIVIPDHGNHLIVRPLLRKIIRDMGLTVEEYNKMVDSL